MTITLNALSLGSFLLPLSKNVTNSAGGVPIGAASLMHRLDFNAQPHFSGDKRARIGGTKRRMGVGRNCFIVTIFA